METTNETPVGSRRWRLARRIAGAALLLAVLSRAAVSLFLPSVLDSIAADRGLSIRYENMDLSVLTGSLELWKLQVRRAGESEEQPGELLTQLEYLTANVKVLALFTGDLVVHRAEIDGLDVHARRTSIEGGWGFEGLFPASETEPQAADSEETAASEFKGYDLALPVQLRALRLQHLQLHVYDGAREPAFTTRLELNVRLTDLGLPQEPARLEIFAHATDWLDALEITGSFESSKTELNAQMDCEVRGLRPGGLTPYLAPLGIRPNAERLELRMACEVEVRTADEQARSLEVKAQLANIDIRADDRECLAIDAIELNLPLLSPTAVQVQTSTLRGVRARLDRLADGHFSVAGIDLVPAPQGRPLDETPAPAGEEQATQGKTGAPNQESAPMAVTIAALRLEDFHFVFGDEMLTPPTELEWTIDQAVLGDIQFLAGHEVQLSASMRSQDVFETLTVEGALVPFGDQLRCQLALQVEGIQPERLAPYLGAMGLQSDFESGRFTGQLEANLDRNAAGVLQANLQVKDVLLGDGAELFALAQVAIRGLQFDPRDNRIRIEELLWDGTRLAVQRDAQGELHFFGLVTGATNALFPANQTAQSVPVETPSEPTQSANGAPPALWIERLAWVNTSVEFIDESGPEPRSLQLDKLGFELSDLRVGESGSGVSYDPARFGMWFESEGLARQLECTGTIQTGPGPLNFDLQLACVGQGLSFQALDPWLSEFGVESRLEEGQLRMQLAGSLKQVDGQLRAGLNINDLHFGTEAETFLALESLALPELNLGAQVVDVPQLSVVGPFLSLERDREGALLALGLRVHPGTGTAPSDTVPVENTTPAPAASSQPSAQSPVLALASFDLRGARIQWKDAAPGDEVQSALTLALSADNLLVGGQGPASPYQLTMGVEGALEELSLNGEVSLDPANFSLQGALSLRGLRAGVLHPYLPPGVAMPLQDGRLGADLLVDYRQREDRQGNSARMELRKLDFRDAGNEEPLLALERLALVAPRLDSQANYFELEELSLTGLELDTRRSADGAIALLGLTLDPAPAATEAQLQPSSAGPEPPVASASGPLPNAKQSTIPTVLLGKLDVGIARLTFLDESEPNAKRLDAQLKLTSAGPLTLLAPGAEELPPIELLVSGAATPIMGGLDARIQLTPFKREPGLSIELRMDGLRGQGLTEVLPALAATLDGSALSDGVFETALAAHLNLRRRSPVDFDLSGGFGLEFELQKFALLDRPGGEELLALKGLDVSVKSIRPGSGDVHVERIELVEPKLHVEKSPEGLHLLGLVLKSAEEATGDEQENDPAASTQPTGVPVSASAKSSGEFRLDELLISGADLSFSDSSVQPAMRLPITDFDLELKRFSTRTLDEQQPFRFNATLYGGDIQLPERIEGGNLVGGLLGSLGSLITQDDEIQLEARPVFDEIVLRGNLSLGPQPKGWTQLRVRALELPTFRGAAREASVEIGDGLLNETAMVHFDGAGGMRVSSHTSISYLSLSEPAGGPISSYLKLPAPLDTVLFVLRDEEGDQNIPLRITIDEGGLSTGTILAAVGRTLGLIIGDAIASSPMKIVGGVLDLAGLEEETIELDGNELALLQFAPGDVLTPADMESQLEPLLALLRSDDSLYLVVQHELSAADLACCDVLANPPAADCFDLAENLRRKRVGLVAQREEHAAFVRSAHAIGDLTAAATGRARLRALENELGSTEAALDRVYELARPGAERGRARRARGTALEVARRRLEAVAERLRSVPIRAISTRVDVRRPRFGITPDLERGTIRVSVQRRQ